MITKNIQFSQVIKWHSMYVLRFVCNGIIMQYLYFHSIVNIKNMFVIGNYYICVLFKYSVLYYSYSYAGVQ